MPKSAVYAHKLIVDAAVGMAHELYDAMMQDNAWWEQWKRQNPGASRKVMERRFVNKNLPRLVPQARATLAHCLRDGVGTSLSEEQKAEIAEALVLDNQLVAARKANFQQLN